MKPSATLLLKAAVVVAASSLLLENVAAAGQIQLTQEDGSISGKILSKDGTPAAGVRVAAMDARNNPTANEASLLSVVQTDSQGQYRLERVPVGRYYITAGFLDTPTYFPGVAVQTQASVVEVTKGALLTGKDFSIVFPTAVSVRGSVIREDSSTSTGRNVVSFNAGFGNTNSAPIAADGSFQINLRPGVYDVNAGSPFVVPSTLTVLDREITDLRLEVPATASVSGTLTVEEKFPVPALQLTFTSVKTGLQYFARPTPAQLRGPTADGIPFTAQLPRGDYRVTTDGLPNGYLLRAITADSRNIVGEILSISAVTPKIAITLGTESLPPMPKVSGHVTGGALTGELGSARRPLSVQLSGSTSWGGIYTVINPDGSFDFPGVLPGTYRMSLPGVNPNVPDVTVIVADRDLTSLVIPTATVKNIQGKVSIDGGGTVPRFGLAFRTIHIFESGGGSSTYSSIVNPSADGSFTVSLPEGEYEVGISSTNPAGYAVKSFTYGVIDLLNNKIVIDGSSATFLLAMAPSGGFPTESVRSIPTLPEMGYMNIAEYPSVVSRVEAQYSDEARRNRIQGGVVLQVIVHSDGSVDPNIKVLRSIGYGLDEQAIEAARKWKFNPGVKNGSPVEGKLQIEIIFRL